MQPCAEAQAEGAVGSLPVCVLNIAALSSCLVLSFGLVAFHCVSCINTNPIIPCCTTMQAHVSQLGDKAL